MSGSVIGTPIPAETLISTTVETCNTIPAFANTYSDLSLVTLPRYAQIMQYPETAFFGINKEGDNAGDCREIWTKYQRDMIARELWAAQQDIESHINYYLTPRWIESEEHPYTDKILYTYKTKLLALGTKATELIQAGVSVSHAADPAVISVVTNVTNISELYICHPGTTIQIIPSSVVISGGTATIQIPRARMLLLSKIDNPSTGWDYTDTSNFESTVDIYRIYNSQDTTATLRWKNGLTGQCNNCDEEYDTNSCARIINYEKGLLNIVLTDISAPCTCTPTSIRINYYSGISCANESIVDAIIRLAHSKMPMQPCGCDKVVYLWERDRNVPEALTANRINCPFGMSAGAWYAWEMVSLHLKTNRGLTL